MNLRLIILFLFFTSISASISYAQRDLENLKSEQDFKQFILAASPSEDAFVAVERLAKPFIDKKDWEGAINVFSKYKERFGNMSDRFDKIIELLKAPSEELEIKNIDAINTDGGEYFPVVTIDGTRMYFTGVDRKDNYAGEDIFYSDLIDSQWQNQSSWAFRSAQKKMML